MNINGVEFVELAAAIAMCQCSRSKLDAAARAGHIATVRPGRKKLFSRPDLQSWLAGQIRQSKPGETAG